MTQTPTKKAQTDGVNFSVFGTRPLDAIFVPQQPFFVRADCKVGIFKVGDDDFRDKKLEISIVKVACVYGTLGKSTTNWVQIWFVPAPSCQVLPAQTLCCMYLKGRSIQSFFLFITELMGQGEPGLGIFEASFTKHSNQQGDYYSVVWNWRERSTETEHEQLELLGDLMTTNPAFVDIANDLVLIDGMNAQELQEAKTQYLALKSAPATVPINGHSEQPQLVGANQ